MHTQIYVIDTAGGDKVPRKGGPGITQSDLLVVRTVSFVRMHCAHGIVYDTGNCTAACIMYLR